MGGSGFVPLICPPDGIVKSLSPPVVCQTISFFLFSRESDRNPYAPFQIRRPLSAADFKMNGGMIERKLRISRTMSREDWAPRMSAHLDLEIGYL